MVKFSEAQERTLLTLDGAVVQWGFELIASGRRTFEALERQGLVRYFPYGLDGKGCWKLTSTGKQVVKKLAAAHTEEEDDP
jgi:hypothetical protein